jgi:hypothetical protein
LVSSLSLFYGFVFFAPVRVGWIGTAKCARVRVFAFLIVFFLLLAIGFLSLGNSWVFECVYPWRRAVDAESWGWTGGGVGYKYIDARKLKHGATQHDMGGGGMDFAGENLWDLEDLLEEEEDGMRGVFLEVSKNRFWRTRRQAGRLLSRCF